MSNGSMWPFLKLSKMKEEDSSLSPSGNINNLLGHFTVVVQQLTQVCLYN